MQIIEDVAENTTSPSTRVLLRLALCVATACAACGVPSVDPLGGPGGGPGGGGRTGGDDGRKGTSAVESALNACLVIDDQLRKIPYATHSIMHGEDAFGFFTGAPSDPIRAEMRGGDPRYLVTSDRGKVGRFEGDGYTLETVQANGTVFSTWSVRPHDGGYRSTFEAPSASFTSETDFSADCRTRKYRAGGGSVLDRLDEVRLEVAHDDAGVMTGTRWETYRSKTVQITFSYDPAGKRWVVDEGPEGAPPETHLVETYDADKDCIHYEITKNGAPEPPVCLAPLLPVR